jgi:LEA14-like dessication related protein
VNEFALKKAVITVYLKILNKSDIDIKIKSQNYKIKVNDYLVSTMNSVEPVVLKAKDTFELPIKITFNPMEVLKVSILSLDQLVTAKDTMKISIDGKFRGGSGFVVVGYPIKYEYTLKELLADTGEENCWDRK